MSRSEAVKGINTSGIAEIPHLLDSARWDQAESSEVAFSCHLHKQPSAQPKEQDCWGYVIPFDMDGTWFSSLQALWEFIGIVHQCWHGQNEDQAWIWTQ